MFIQPDDYADLDVRALKTTDDIKDAQSYINRELSNYHADLSAARLEGASHHEVNEIKLGIAELMVIKTDLAQLYRNVKAIEGEQRAAEAEARRLERQARHRAQVEADGELKRARMEAQRSFEHAFVNAAKAILPLEQFEAICATARGAA